MAVLEPCLAILDETDSGLDIDALKTVADGVNLLRRPDNALLVITHYQRLPEYIFPDHVHVLPAVRLPATGGKDLPPRLKHNGYPPFPTPARRSGHRSPPTSHSPNPTDPSPPPPPPRTPPPP